MTEQHSVFSGRRCEAPQHHHSQWASLRLQASKWGGAGVGGAEEKTGWWLLFIPHVSGSGPHKFLCLVYFTQLSK